MEALIRSSFRAKRSADPESGLLKLISQWIWVFAGMTPNELIRDGLNKFFAQTCHADEQ